MTQKKLHGIGAMGVVMSLFTRILGIISTLFFVAACGGGGDGGGSGGGTQPPTSFAVSTATTGSGSGSISPTSRTVSQGSTTSFTISPASGSTINNVSGCGGSLNGTTYTTGPINAACSVMAEFNPVVITPPELFSLQATAGDQQVTLTWPEQDVDTYNLCQAREPILEIENCRLYNDGTLSLDVQGPPLVVSGLENGQRYYFRLEATAAGGRLVSILADSVPVAGVTVLNRPELYVIDDRGVLGVVDPNTGSVEIIGRTGVNMTDIAFHPGGDLYGISFSFVYKVNKNTASAKAIGSHAIFSGNSLTFSEDGFLLAAGAGSTDLFKLDPLTGTSQNLGNTGYYAAGDLAFYENKLFLSAGNGDLVSVDSQEFVETAPVGSLGRSDVFGLAPWDDDRLLSPPGDDDRFYGVGGTDIFKINSETGASFDPISFRGQGLDTAYGMAASKPPLFPIHTKDFPIHTKDPRSQVSTCFGAFGPDDGTKLTYVREGLFHPAVDLAFVVGTQVQAPTSGTLVYYRRPDSDLMNTYLVLQGDDLRSYIFGHVYCSSDVCDTARAARASTDPYPVESRERVARGQILGSIGALDAQHLHFGVVTGSMVNADGTLRQEFRDGDVTWATIKYGSATVATADDARQLARARGFVDPMSLYVRPTGCETLHTGVVGLMSSTVTIRVENSGNVSDGPYEAFVEPAVEFELGSGSITTPVEVAVDVADSTIVFDYSDAGTGSFATSSFNGYVMELATGDLTWASVAVDPSTTLQLDANRVSFDEKNIRINVSGLQYSSSSKIVLRVHAERQ